MFEWQQVSQTLYIQSLLGNEMTTIRISNINPLYTKLIIWEEKNFSSHLKRWY